MNGDSALSSHVSGVGVGISNDGSQALTRRELLVVGLLARGGTYSEIGNHLGISFHTVASHVKNLYRKLGVHSSPAAVMKAVQLRLLPADA